MKLNLRIWRQADSKTHGKFVGYDIDDISPDMSFLEMMDVLNDRLIAEGKDPIAFDHDCREGICGSCGVMINGVAHGPMAGTATCQLHMRSFKDGDVIVVEPFRAAAFNAPSNRTHHELLLIEVGPDAAPLPAGRRVGLYHFGLKVGDSDDTELLDLLASDGSQPDDLVDGECLRSDIRSILDQLPDLQGRVLKMRYGIPCADVPDPDEPMSLTGIGRILGMSRNRVRNLERDGLANLRRLSQNVQAYVAV